MNGSQYLFTITTAVLVGGLAVPAQASSLFGNSGIQFDTTTEVTFNFLESHSGLINGLSIADASGNPLFNLFQETKRSDNPDDVAFNKQYDYPGTCGGANSAVPNCTNTFSFQGGTLYTLRLDSKEAAGTPNKPTVFSTNSLNAGGTQYAQFFGSDPFAGIRIYFEDGAYRPEADDRDFNDFRISATAKPVPVPSPLGGMALFGTLAFFNRRRLARKTL